MGRHKKIQTALDIEADKKETASEVAVVKSEKSECKKIKEYKALLDQTVFIDGNQIELKKNSLLILEDSIANKVLKLKFIAEVDNV